MRSQLRLQYQYAASSLPSSTPRVNHSLHAAATTTSAPRISPDRLTLYRGAAIFTIQSKSREKVASKESEMAEKEEGLLSTLEERSIEHSLLKARKVFLWSPVDDESAKAIVTRLLSLDAQDPEGEIVLYINSPGGTIHDGLAIYDAMQAISCKVSTVCTGMAASMGAVLLAGGEKGRRFTGLTPG